MRVIDIVNKFFKDCDSKPYVVENTNKFSCFILESHLGNSIEHGWGNGYVIASSDTFLYKFCKLVDTNANQLYWQYPLEMIETHGGLTFAEIQGDYLMVGFDTVHLGDNQENMSQSVVQGITIKLYNDIIELENSIILDCANKYLEIKKIMEKK